MKEIYTKAEIDVLLFENADIITTSGNETDIINSEGGIIGSEN